MKRLPSKSSESKQNRRVKSYFVDTPEATRKPVVIWEWHDVVLAFFVGAILASILCMFFK